MNVHKLEWDSEFFGLRIGRADLQTKEDAMQLSGLQGIIHQEYDLLYVFDANHVGFSATGSKMVDEKVLYKKACTHNIAFDDVKLYEYPQPSVALYQLAHESGKFSRFRLDTKLPNGCFERLYNRWIENACPKKGSNKQIFVYCPENTPKGMITVDFNSDGLAHIGLVSVNAKCQHNGIGTKIMSTVEEYLYRKGTIHTLEVPTQKANKNACLWYEHNGFSIASIVDIYHWWL